MTHKLLVVTYRFGPDIAGGAERHLWELAARLRRDHGVECEVWTTTALDLSPVAHWGCEMRPGFAPGTETTADGLVIRRFPLSATPRVAIALGAKALQRRWEREERGLDPARLPLFGGARSDLSDGSDSSDKADLCDLPDLLPGYGWHLCEYQPDGSILRWTMPAFTLLRRAGAPAAELELSGFSPRARTLRFFDERGATLTAHDVRDWFTVRVALPAAGERGGVVRGDCGRAFRPLKDHRSLGVMVSRLAVRAIEAETMDGMDRVDSMDTAGPIESVHAVHSVRPVHSVHSAAAGAQAAAIPLWLDYRAVLRRHWDNLVSLYMKRGISRPAAWGRLFDWLRGPRAPALWRALSARDLGRRFDGVLAANLPWGVIPAVARRCRLPMAALALWHLDDEFYYWPHYVEALRGARVVLSNTKWAAESVWPRFGVQARWAGPGVDGRWAGRAASAGRAAWRERLGLAADAPVVLSVARKSAAKRYEILVEAVERIRARGRVPGATLVLVGPDEDRRPLNSPAVVYVGAMDDAALHDAYLNADVFAMMSESESFGMVFVEAWMRGLPVVANRWCAPVASLIDDGADGFLVSDAREAADAIERLLGDAALRERFGRAGREKTLRDHTWASCAARVAGALDECLFGG